MSPRAKKQCGLAITFPREGGEARGLWCVLDKWPRHKCHLFVTLEDAEKMPTEEREQLLRVWREQPGGSR